MYTVYGVTHKSMYRIESNRTLSCPTVGKFGIDCGKNQYKEHTTLKHKAE